MSTSISVGDISVMAVGCLYLNAERAVVDFPTTSRARPSEWVVVYPTVGRLLREKDKRHFPFRVPWYIWHQVVLPVLQDSRYQFWDARTGQIMAQNVSLLRLKEYDTLIEMYENALTAKFEQEGYIPEGGSTEESVGVDLVGSGEPIVEKGTLETGDSDFPVLDSESYWPEGHPKLTYPEVE